MSPPEIVNSNIILYRVLAWTLPSLIHTQRLESELCRELLFPAGTVTGKAWVAVEAAP
jgi:hypothetical protein